MGGLFVNFKVGFRPFQFQQVRRARQMERADFRLEVPALFEQVGNVFTTISLQLVGVGQGPHHRLGAMNFAQGDNLTNMGPGLDAALFELPVIHLGQRSQL